MRAISAKTFHGSLKGGSSRPIVVSDECGDRYVVKLAGSGGGARGLALEAMASAMGASLKLPVLPWAIAELPRAYVQQVGDDELVEVVRKSIGANLAFPWLKAVKPLERSAFDSVELSTRDALYLFDVMMLNVDRTRANSNLVISGDNLWALDYGACARLSMPDDPERQVSYLRVLRGHPFFRMGVSVADFQQRLGAARDCSPAFERIPRAWIERSEGLEMRSLSARAKDILEDVEWFAEAIACIEDLPEPSDEQRRARVNENRRDFERKTGLTLRR